MHKAAVELRHDVHIRAVGRGPLYKTHQSYGPIIPDVRTGYDLYIPSSVMSLPVAQELRRRGLPTLPILHEATDFATFSKAQQFDPRTWLLDRFAMVLNVSKPQQNALAAVYPTARFLTLEYCCPAELFPSEASPPRSTLIVPGSWETRKGQDRLLALLARMEYLPTGLTITFTCHRPQNANLDDHPHADRLVFAGPLDPPALQTALRASLGLVSLSRSETKGLAVMEALWHGKPVFLSDLAAFRTFDWHSMTHFADEDDDTAAQELSRWISDLVSTPPKLTSSDQRNMTARHSFESYVERLNLAFEAFHLVSRNPYSHV